MSIFKRKRLIALTAVLLICSLIIPAYADVTQSDISEAVAAKEQREQELISTEERIHELELLKGDSENYLNELSTQLADLEGRLDGIRTLCDERKTELEQVKAELEAQNALEKEQYEDMKLRIQYMYEETSNSGLLESLFSAESFSDFLNRAETMSEINRYDRDMLESYSETIKQIEKKEQELLEEQAELVRLQEDLNAQITQIQQIYELTYNDLKAYAEAISENEEYGSSIVAQIRRQEEAIDYLLAQAYAEEAARRAEEEAYAAAIAAANEAAASEAAYDPGEEVQPDVPESFSEEASEAPAPAAEAAAPAEDGAEGAQEAPAAEPEAAPAPEAPEAQAEEVPAEGGTYLGNFTLTAYCGCAKCCGQWASANPTTASGAPCVEGVTVAMGGVPFGTQLLINGTVYTVQDRGTAYGHVDIYFNDHSSALAFGMKHADVYQVG